MKNSVMISALGVVAVAALVTFSNSTAQDMAEEKNTQQKVVWLHGPPSGCLSGDDTGKGLPQQKGLPKLLEAGWRIVSITPSGGSVSESSHGYAYALLEK